MRTLSLLMLSAAAFAQTRPVVTLEGSVAKVEIDRLGGSIVKFEFKDQALNPLKWANENAGMEKRAMAHFLCLDRWGQVSDSEGKSGMPYHGEATRVEWSATPAGSGATRMTTHLPIANMDVTRAAKVHPSQALLLVTESVTNRNKLGRPYNMVQHPTVGPPFLDETVVVDANARAGFMQGSPMPDPEHPTVYWPQALKDGQPVNLRTLINDPMPNVVSYVVDDELGWVTAVNAAKGLLIGYIWRTKEYPWLNIWRHVDDSGRPMARGLEFGTTGLHQPFSVLVKKGKMFGRPVFDWLEPEQTHTRSYAVFLFKVPAGYRGVESLTYRNGNLTLKERDGNRTLSMDAGSLWP
ncbi:MAG: hypothetical protein JST93_33770 [Acidobacteria bacterium]|nr:hypothetical protein [Acidobacteriota bacterium]